MPREPAPSPPPRSEKLLKVAASVPRESLVSLGTCFGKFTKTQKFRLSVTALDFLAPYAKVGHSPHPLPAPRRAPSPSPLRASLAVQGVGEARLGAVLPLRQPRPEVGPGPDHGEHGPVPGRGGVLHGRHPAGECLVWTLCFPGLGCGENSLSPFPSPPLQGFGVAAKSTQECRKVDPMVIVVFHQADVGEYVRSEDTLT